MSQQRPKSASKDQKGAKKSSKQNFSKPKGFLTPSEIEELKACFDLFDQRGDGVDPREMHRIMTELGLDRNCPAVYNIVNDLLDIPDKLYYESFIRIVEDRLGDSKSRAGAAILFKYFDTEDTGRIGFDEIKKMVKYMGGIISDEDIKRMIHCASVLHRTEEKDTIDVDEFYEIITRKKY